MPVPDGEQPRLGVLAFGDSITNGGGELQWGVALQSWALYVARGLGLPYTPYAVDGAVAADVVGQQIPAFESRNADPAARYELGCLYVGVNDVRLLQWSAERFAAAYDVALRFLCGRCDRVLVVLLPLDLGRPRAGARVHEANAAIEQAAATHGALVLDLRQFGGREHLMADHVHPTALGQVAIAEAALDVLRSDGAEVRVRPSELVTYVTSPWGRARSVVTYAYRYMKLTASAAVVGAVARAAAAVMRAVRRGGRS